LILSAMIRARPRHQRSIDARKTITGRARRSLNPA
jgi:hypothetical protein